MHNLSAEASRAFLRRVILPLAALVACLLLFAIGGIIWIADFQTNVAIRHEALLARGAIKMQGNRLAAEAADYGRWDEALAATVDKFDFKWLSSNIGEAAETSYGAELVFILDPNGKTVYSRVDHTNGRIEVMNRLPLGFMESFRRWRQQPAYATYSGLIPYGDRAAIIAIAPLRPFDDKSTRAPTGYSVTFVDVIDEAMLKTLATDYNLTNLRIARSERDVANNIATIAIKGSNDATILSLAWDPKRPGDELLKVALPFMSLFLSCILVLGIVIFRYAILSAQLISDREKRAFSDPLTGLANRTRLFSVLNDALVNIIPGISRITVMYIDLDGFKTINDSMGHAAGDELLIQVSDRLRSCVRDQDLVARIGGDEFVFVIKDFIDDSRLDQISDAIMKHLTAPFDLSSGIANISASIGVAQCNDNDIDSNTLLARADLALYEAKGAGKNTIRSHPGSSVEDADFLRVA
jgi:diguanylate cyclase (GGDEF)-like protein